MQVEISARLMQVIRDLAEAQGRGENDVLEEAVERYVQELGIEREANIGREIDREYIEPLEGPSRPRDPFLALLDRMRSRFELDPDEAMQIAVEEQHAARRERREKAER